MIAKPIVEAVPQDAPEASVQPELSQQAEPLPAAGESGAEPPSTAIGSETTGAEPLPTAPAPGEAGAAPQEPAAVSLDTPLRAYWQRVLTGDAASIPVEVQQRAGAADATLSGEEREYRLLSAVNRSWAADFSGRPRARVAAEWPMLRQRLAQSLGSGDNEPELFASLSQVAQDEPRRRQARELYTRAYERALEGAEAEPETETPESRVAALGYAEGARERKRILPLADRVAQAMAAVEGVEGGKITDMFRFYARVPELMSVVDTLAETDPQQRAALYRVAMTRLPEGRRGRGSSALLPTMWAAAQRGSANLNWGLLQGVGHTAAATLDQAGRSLNAPALSRAADGTDARLQVFEELRRRAQGEAYPVRLAPDASLAEQMMVDAAEATPGAALAFCGGAGFGLLSLSGMGEAVAAARERAPEGDRRLQTAAGVLGAAVQAGIFCGMSRVGGQMLNRSLGEFARAHGAKGYSLAALKSVGSLTAENVKLLMAAKAGQTADLGLQELAARLSDTASNIDWQSYGRNMVDVEQNMREAARTLPFVLIGSGRVALRHFRYPQAILGAQGEALGEWGVGEAERQRILAEPDINRRDRMLYEAIHNSKRWSGAGFLTEALRALKLLQTPECRVFEKEETVRDFLQLPAETSQKLEPFTPADISKPEVVEELTQRFAEGQPVTKETLPYLQLADAWHQKAFPKELPQGVVQTADLLDPKLRALGDFTPETAEERRRAIGEVIRLADSLSYRFLLNTTSVETMLYRGKDVHTTLREGEALRRRFIGKLAEAVLERVLGTPAEGMTSVVGDFVTRYHLDHFRSMGVHAWQYRAKPRNLARIFTRAMARRDPVNHLHPREFYDAIELVRNSRAVADTLCTLLLYHPDFQTGIARGMTPQDSMAHLLHRELGNRLPGDSWMPKIPETDATDRAEYTRQNEEMMQRYRFLCGVEPEQRVGDDGQSYWRVQTPDGRYTRWHSTREQAVNDLAAGMRLRFLNLDHALMCDYNAARGPEGFDANAFSLGQEREYSYFDRLTAMATNDLQQLWHENVSLTEPGVGIGPLRRRVKLLKHSERLLIKGSPGFYDHLRMGELSVSNPFAYFKGRLTAHWFDALQTGRVAPREAIDFLLRQGVVTPKEASFIMRSGAWHRRTAPVREHYRTESDYLDAVNEWWPRRFFSYSAARDRHLAEHLGRSSMGYLLNHLQELPLPESVREWFGLSAFARPMVGRGLTRRSGRVLLGRSDATMSLRRTLRHTVEEMREFLPFAEQWRKAETEGEKLTEDPFFPTLVDALVPSESRRLEQSWSYAMSGDHEFRNREPGLWNVLRSPAQGWSRLTEAQRETLAGRFNWLCEREGAPEDVIAEPDTSDVPPALQRLDKALQEHPELRRYDFYPEDGRQLLQLNLRPLDLRSVMRPEEVTRTKADYSRPGVLQRDFDLQPVEVLPPELSEQQGALHDLSRLRRAVMSLPYADERGVWWNYELYSQDSGRLLPGMDASWTMRRPLQTLQTLFTQLSEEGEPGMQFGDCRFAARPPLPEEALRRTCIYESEANPLTHVRLMPGSRSSLSGDLRSPYVVHTFVGAPLQGGRMLPNGEQTRFLYQTLDRFLKPDRRFKGHMLNFHGMTMVEEAWNALMERTENEHSLENSRSALIPNTELLMALAEDCRFGRVMAGKAPHEYSEPEALASLFLYALARHEYAGDADARHELLTLSDYLHRNPEKAQAVREVFHTARRTEGADSLWKWSPTALKGATRIDHGYIRKVKPLPENYREKAPRKMLRPGWNPEPQESEKQKQKQKYEPEPGDEDLLPEQLMLKRLWKKYIGTEWKPARDEEGDE
ncbi:MAG: hypothetical protein ACI4OS_03375 [Akkermansia sp.]